MPPHSSDSRLWRMSVVRNNVKKALSRHIAGIITRIFSALPDTSVVYTMFLIIHFAASEADKTQRNIKQFGGHKKINIYATKNLNKYKSESRVEWSWSGE
jgi:hypothetical protein